MPDVELTRVAGHVVDVLGMLGFSSEQIAIVGDLVQKHAGIRDKYEDEALHSTRTLAHMPN